MLYAILHLTDLYYNEICLYFDMMGTVKEITHYLVTYMMYEAITNLSSYIYKIAFKYSYTGIRQINNLQINAN